MGVYHECFYMLNRLGKVFSMCALYAFNIRVYHCPPSPYFDQEIGPILKVMTMNPLDISQFDILQIQNTLNHF
jgi:hypothetical protein